MPILDAGETGALPCACSQGAVSTTCALTPGAGIDIDGTEPAVISAESAKPWVSYTPTTQNFTIGNGINVSRYLLVGKTLHGLIGIQFGSTSTFSASAWGLGLPAGVVPHFDFFNITGGHIRATASMLDASSGQYWQGKMVLTAGTAFPVQVKFGGSASPTNTFVSSTVPFTWDDPDQLFIRFEIEVI